MKTLNSSFERFAIPVLACGFVSCLMAADDPNAGNWRMSVLTSPSQVAVPAPIPTSDASFKAELAAIKAAQSALTADQKTAIDYWKAGGAVRWNEILLELVASTDLPPEPNPDGSYPAPDANNPFANPRYPFANPPYGARAYSYVSVAMFEALKSAWYYKYLYNRPAPAKADTGIQALLSVTDLPAYPSEDAVESGVAVVLMKLLFPTGVDLINRRAAEQQQVALLSGRATASDIAAGYALGQAVATVFQTRAGSDGMKAAAGTTALWQAIADATAAKGEMPWKSQEVPPRPPMLPFYGAVKGWNMTPADIVNERPGPPPSTSSAQMKAEIEEVKNVQKNLTRAQLAIATKWADGVSSPTPPGHWNFIAQPYIGKAGFSEVRAARAFALLNMALMDAAIACWDTKYFYYNPRPAQMDKQIKTVIGLPNFPAYTSGHSAFSAAAASVLTYLFPSGKDFFDAQTDEAAISRLYGAIHFRSDIEVGKTQGRRVATYTVKFAQNDGADGPISSVSSAVQTLDAASFRSPVAPGSIATVFQPNIAPAMVFNGTIPVHVFATAPNQANIQIPWELQGQTTATLKTLNPDGSTLSFAVPLAAYAPAIFSTNERGSGQGLITNSSDGKLAAATGTVEGRDTRAVAKGDFVTIYCVGLGPVENPPATGAVTLDASSIAKSPVTVIFNGDTSVPAAYAGLSPGFIGMFQVNVQVPNSVPSGNSVTLAISVAGTVSNTVALSIQ